MGAPRSPVRPEGGVLQVRQRVEAVEVESVLGEDELGQRAVAHPPVDFQGRPVRGGERQPDRRADDPARGKHGHAPTRTRPFQDVPETLFDPTPESRESFHAFDRARRQPAQRQRLEHSPETAHPIGAGTTASVAFEQIRKVGILSRQIWGQSPDDAAEVVLVEFLQHHRFRPGSPGFGAGGADDVRRLPLPRPRPAIGLVKVGPPPGPKLAQQSRLVASQFREFVVFVGEERCLSVADQRQRAHRLASAACRPGPSYLRNSSLAMASRWTSSGPSARRRARAQAQAAARPKSALTPAPPCAWMARSITRRATCGATTLIMAISARASLLPTVSIMYAALSVRSRACSISMRESAMSARIVPCSASGLPKATRESTRRHMASRERSATPMRRMQWWTRPGPSRPWAISKPRPSPSRMFAAGTRTFSKCTSAWPCGAWS